MLARWLVIIFVFANLATLIDVFNIPNLGFMVDRADSRISGPISSVNQYGAVLAFVLYQAITSALPGGCAPGQDPTPLTNKVPQHKGSITSAPDVNLPGENPNTNH